MGGSSRAKDFKHDQFTPKDCVDYFLHYLARWRQKLPGIINRLNRPENFY